MTKRSLVIFAILNTLLVASLASYFTTKWHDHRDHGHAGHQDETDFHEWLHSQLDLTPEQLEALHPAEEAYEQETLAIQKKISLASQRLAEAIQSGQANDPEVSLALAEVSARQADLKRLMLDHFFAMKGHLDSKQAAKLQQWVHDSLLAPASR